MVQALGAIIFFAVVYSIYSSYQFNTFSNQATRSLAQVERVKTELNKITSSSEHPKKNEALDTAISNATQEITSMQQAMALLKSGDIGNTDGYSDYLGAFSRQIVDDLWLTGFSIVGAGKEMSLQGRALRPASLPAYIERLKKETVMQGISFSSLQMHVPQIAPVKKDVQSVALVNAPYVEFELQSAGIENQTSAAPKPAAVARPAPVSAPPLPPVVPQTVALTEGKRP